ncbi:MAG: OmpA family protein [Brevinematales bacterium]
MKIGLGGLLIILIAAFVSCSGSVKQTIPAAAPAVTNSSPVETNTDAADDFDSALTEFRNTTMDIPFSLKSADLNLDNSKYYIKNQSIENFMKKSLIPVLTKVIKTMSSDKVVVISGYASKIGTEEPGKNFIGNIALSKDRAQAVLDYLLKNTGWDKSKFKIKFYGSSMPLSGIDPADLKNCRVSIDIE